MVFLLPHLLNAGNTHSTKLFIAALGLQET